MAGFLRAQVILVVYAVGQSASSDPIPSLSRWADATGASASEGDVITCTWGVLCRHGFQRGKEEICESHFECAPSDPSGAPVEPAQVPQGQGTEHKPDVPAQGTAEVPAQVAPVPVPPHKDAPDTSEAGDATPTKPAASPVANVSHAAVNAPKVSGTQQQDVSGRDASDSAILPPRHLRGAMPPRGVSKGAGRLLGAQANQIQCECGVVCQWGFRTEGGRKVCNGPLYCSSCMPMSGAYGGVAGRR
ncbi:unnamed protein product [Durusdinium trenchii]|uniref:Uncharacterized protein n=1 Tax=Durusdinium trenchii TaxID=1381693 RepID=A0ABP0L034_9DINO